MLLKKKTNLSYCLIIETFNSSMILNFEERKGTPKAHFDLPLSSLLKLISLRN